jgi:hypothetical protein
MEKEGGASKGLRTTSKEGITITNLTKKSPFIFQLKNMGGEINYNK